MEKLQSSGDQEQYDRQIIRQFTEDLVHASQCSGTNCALPTCRRMKRVLRHVASCKIKTNGRCPICCQLIALCCYHAKNCQDNNCSVRYCSTVKKKMRHLQLQRRFQQIRTVMRHIPSNPGISPAVLQTTPGSSNSSRKPPPGAKPHSSPHPHQPGIAVEPLTGPPFGVFLQAVEQAQAPAAGQTVPYMIAASESYGIGNLVLSPPIPNTGLGMSATQQIQDPVVSPPIPNTELEIMSATQQIQDLAISPPIPNTGLGMSAAQHIQAPVVSPPIPNATNGAQQI